MDDAYVSCATVPPMEVVNALAPRATQIIPLELMAAAGLLFTFGKRVRGRDAIFFIDNQSVCGALTKGSSKSRDIQHLSTAWHIMCQQLGCRVWFEWVPSESNPADILSRQAISESEVTDLFASAADPVELELPPWVHQGRYDTMQKILDAL